MKAVLFTGKGNIEIVERPIPRAKKDWAVIRVTASAICGTDTELLLPAENGSPIIPGHEVAGVVHEVDEYHGFAPGERVLVNCHVTCGVCEHCRAGDLIFCPELRAVGFEIDGGNAEYLTVPVGSLRHIPDDIDAELAVLAGDALGTPWNAARKAKPEKGKLIAVFGVGPIGQMATACLVHEGAAVVAIDMNAARLETARSFGAQYTIDISKQDVLEEAGRITGGKGFDAVLQCSPSQKAINQGLDTLALRGTLVQVGVCTSATINPFEQINNREITIIGSRNFNDRDLPKLFDFIRTYKQVSSIITHRYPLEQARKAFDTALSGEGVKVLLTPSDYSS